MMTVYRPIKSSSSRPRRLQIIIGLVVAALFLLGLSQTNFRHSLTGLGVKIFKPFWAISSGLDNGLTGVIGFFTSKVELAEENARLKALVTEQTISLLKQSILEKENESLRTVLNREVMPRPLTVGRILDQGLQFPFSTALIDTGRERVSAPLSLGVVVVVEGAVALGELIEIYDTGAKLRFYSTPDDRLNASLGEDHVPIELVGRGGGNFTASLPRDLPVEVGDQITVTVAGHEFILATVSDIKVEAGDSFQEIYLRTPVNLAQLTWVELYEP